MTCPRWLHPPLAQSKTAPKQTARIALTNMKQFTWMLVRETLERDTRESRWSPISHSDSSISRPTPLISVSSSTMVLRNQKYKRTNTESFDRRKSMIPRALYVRGLTWRLEQDTPGRDIAVSDLEFPRSRMYGFYRQWRTWALRNRPVLQIKLPIKCEVSIDLIYTSYH